MSKKYDDYLKTDYWKAVSMAVKKRGDYRCQLCNSQHDLQAHHRTYENRGKELDHWADLICVCRRCHGIFHGTITIIPVAVEKTAGPRKPKRSHTIPHEPVDAEMPAGDPIVLTPELVSRCRANGSFTNATVRAFGLSRGRMSAGWPARLVGVALTREAYRDALEGRFKYNSGRLE